MRLIFSFLLITIIIHTTNAQEYSPDTIPLFGLNPYLKCMNPNADLRAANLLFNFSKSNANRGYASRALELLRKEIDECKVPVEKVAGSLAVITKLEERNSKIKIFELNKEIDEDLGFVDVSNRISLLKNLRNKWLQNPDFTDVIAWEQKNDESANNLQSTCQAKDYRDLMTAARNQQDLGWCYAYGLAEVLSVKLGKSISATDLAINYIKNTPHSDTRWLKKTIFDAKDSQEGVCLEINVAERDQNILNLRARLNRIEEQKLSKECSPSELSANVRNLFPFMEAAKALKIHAEKNILSI